MGLLLGVGRVVVGTQLGVRLAGDNLVVVDTPFVLVAAVGTPGSYPAWAAQPCQLGGMLPQLGPFHLLPAVAAIYT